jgi:hypothetical protein
MSSPDRAERVAQIVEEALERDPADYASFLDAACDGDADVARKLNRFSAFAPRRTPSSNNRQSRPTPISWRTPLVS